MDKHFGPEAMTKFGSAGMMAGQNALGGLAGQTTPAVEGHVYSAAELNSILAKKSWSE